MSRVGFACAVRDAFGGTWDKACFGGIQDGDNGNRAGRSDGTLLNLKERQGRLTFLFSGKCSYLEQLDRAKDEGYNVKVVFCTVVYGQF